MCITNLGMGNWKLTAMFTFVDGGVPLNREDELEIKVSLYAY